MKLVKKSLIKRKTIFKGKRAIITKAYAPDDIFLENLIYEGAKSVLRRLVSMFLVIILTSVFFLAAAGLRYWARVARDLAPTY